MQNHFGYLTYEVFQRRISLSLLSGLLNFAQFVCKRELEMMRGMKPTSFTMYKSSFCEFMVYNRLQREYWPIG